MTRVTVRPSADRSRLELSSRTPGLDVVGALRNAKPPFNVSVKGGRVSLAMAEGIRLTHAELPFELDVDVLARRCIDNRSAVVASSDAVRDEVTVLMEGSNEQALGAVQDCRLVHVLDQHQIRNVAVMTVPNGWGTAVFDEQGTGKTPTLIAAFDLLVERREAEQLLVVAPKSMVAEWQAEFERFTGDRYNVAIVDGNRANRAHAIDSGADVVTMNYESVISMAENLKALAKRSRTVLAVDESFFVKNPDSARSAAVSELREWCSRCFVLCGTPAPNSPADLVAQFNLVDFGLTFSGIRLDEDRDTAATQVRRLLGERGHYLRSRKEDVLPDLPARTFTRVPVELAPIQRRIYEEALDGLIHDLNAADDERFSQHLLTYLERRSALLRICSDPSAVVDGYRELPAKVAALDSILSTAVSERRKVVVWCFYRATLGRLYERYRDFGIVRIDGSVTDAADRRDAVRRFQEDEDTMVFLGNPAAAGAGLTLHRAHTAVYESISNQAAHFLQSLDRIHRRGQIHEVEYLMLLGRGTLEEEQLDVLESKATRQRGLLGDPGGGPPSRTVLLDELLDSRERLRAGPS